MAVMSGGRVFCRSWARVRHRGNLRISVADEAIVVGGVAVGCDVVVGSGKSDAAGQCARMAAAHSWARAANARSAVS